jgi:hypothetical protein
MGETLSFLAFMINMKIEIKKSRSPVLSHASARGLISGRRLQPHVRRLAYPANDRLQLLGEIQIEKAASVLNQKPVLKCHLIMGRP